MRFLKILLVALLCVSTAFAQKVLSLHGQYNSGYYDFQPVSSVTQTEYVDLRSTIYRTHTIEFSIGTGTANLTPWDGFVDWKTARRWTGAALSTSLYLSPTGMTWEALPLLILAYIENPPLSAIGFLNPYRSISQPLKAP